MSAAPIWFLSAFSLMIMIGLFCITTIVLYTACHCKDSIVKLNRNTTVAAYIVTTFCCLNLTFFIALPLLFVVIPELVCHFRCPVIIPVRGPANYATMERSIALPTCHVICSPIFNEQFIIGFQQPSNDRCKTCVAHKLVPAPTAEHRPAMLTIGSRLGRWGVRKTQWRLKTKRMPRKAWLGFLKST